MRSRAALPIASCRPLVLVALILALLMPAIAAFAQAAGPTGAPGEPGYVPGEVLIGWAPDAAVIPAVARSKGLDEDRTRPDWWQAVDALATRTGLRVLDAHPAYHAARLAVKAGEEESESRRLAAFPWVTFAEPNYIARAADVLEMPGSLLTVSDYYPNDPFVGDEWYMRRVAAPAAWAVTLGSHSIVVAVVDSGVDMTHPEFAYRLLPGWDYVNSDPYPTDANGHGTHVAGLLAAAADNMQGIAGLAPHIKILPLQVLDISGFGTYDNIASAIEHATDSAVAVINLSLGGVYPSARLKQAVDYARSHGVLVVAAAGNCAQGGAGCGYLTNPDYYPAAYDGVVAVAASNRLDGWTGYSGYKPYVDLAAPGGTSGEQIWSTVPGGYDFDYGTSMATPLVSGAAALVWTLTPSTTSDQVIGILRSTADKVGVYTYAEGRNDYFGYGRLNVGRAVRWSYPPSLIPVSGTQVFLLDQTVSQRALDVAVENPSDQAIWWKAAVTRGSGWLQVAPTSDATTYSNPSNLTLTADASTLSSGIYTGTVRVESLYPAVGGYDIHVRLWVASQLSRTYLPLATNQHLRATWIDPTEGTRLDLTDNTARQVLLPFPVHFFGETYNELYVSDNGLVTFGLPHSGAPGIGLACSPSAATPNNAIYVLWSDLNPDLGGQIYVQKLDSLRYMITWHEVPDADGKNPQSFQLVIFRQGGLLFQYLDITQPLQGTIGIENVDGTLAEFPVCGGVGRAISDGDALMLAPTTPW